uniref:peptidylprolyl isomerase n=1 Tax=Palpitomonas bilix TaxID=652834 RepID=A0A7S3DCN6_9EUKA|mmetsp:Transcript_31694/g.82714  ORF Transcript_31694/g.82714 Transcript_31694/m.82714 type:complete len:132 (+) Transcript_31694:355-750(+)
MKNLVSAKRLTVGTQLQFITLDTSRTGECSIAVAQETRLCSLHLAKGTGARILISINFTYAKSCNRNVISGWEEGVQGMKEGGQRRLVVPSELGYGRKGRAPVIPPNTVRSRIFQPISFPTFLKLVSDADL